jgi:hypothetical protein
MTTRCRRAWSGGRFCKGIFVGRSDEVGHEKNAMKQLGILVKSAARIDWVFHLAEAANLKGKTVWVHFAENGVRGLRGWEIDKLSRCGKVSICSTSAERFGLKRLASGQCDSYLAPPSAMAELVRTCERHVVL